MIWINKSLCLLVKKVEILSKILSYHSPVLCRINVKGGTYRWRLDERLLDKKENLEHMEKEIKYFFDRNWTG